MKTKLIIALLLLRSMLAFSQERDPWLRPFDKESIWNMPIGDSAVYKDANMKAAYAVTFDFVHIMKLDANDPLRPVYGQLNMWRDRCGEDMKYQGYKLNIPDGFYVEPDNPDGGKYGHTPNSTFAFLKTNGKHLIQGQVLARCDPYGPVYYPKWVDPNSNELIFGDGLNSTDAHGHGASGMNALGGTIRVGELSGDDSIRHALKLCIYAKDYLYYSDSLPGYKWPSKGADAYANTETYGGDNPEFVMGTLLAIPALHDKSTLNLESSEGGKIYDAMKNYGAYVVEDAAWDCHYLVAEAGIEEELPDGNFYWAEGRDGPFRRDINKIFEELHIVTNNGPANIGGGGEPLQPLAPDFANTSPAAGFSVSTNESLKADFDASASTDYENNALAYAWNFGDGHTGEGLTTSHTYDEAGIYQVTLTITEIKDSSRNTKLTKEILVPNTMSGFPRILNGSFEQGVFSWDTSKINVSVISDGYGDGHAMLLQEKKTEFSRGLSQTLYGLLADTSYTLSYYAKSPANQKLSCIVSGFTTKYQEYRSEVELSGTFEKYDISFTTKDDNYARVFFDPKENKPDIIIDSVTISKKVELENSVITVGRSPSKHLLVYPNPALGLLNVEFHSNNKIHSWKIFNVKGTLVSSGQSSSEVIQIDISGLACGVYYIYCQNNDSGAEFIKKDY